VLISQSYSAALGIPVPSPFFLQELLLGFFEKQDDEVITAKFSKIFYAAEVSERDQAFYEAVTAGLDDWWDATSDEEVVMPHISALFKMLREYMDEV